VAASGLFGVANTISDSLGNTWTPLTMTTSVTDSQLFYCVNPIVGPNQTFTNSTSYDAGIAVASFSGVAAAPLDGQSGATVVGYTLQPGSVTPSGNGELVISGLGSWFGSSLGVSSGFTSISSPGAIGGNIAYQIQSAATSVNPTWTSNANDYLAATIAVFKPEYAASPTVQTSVPVATATVPLSAATLSTATLLKARDAALMQLTASPSAATSSPTVPQAHARTNGNPLSAATSLSVSSNASGASKVPEGDPVIENALFGVAKIPLGLRPSVTTFFTT
jgi:hypothetical protein